LQVVLELVVARTCAKSAYLYLVTEAGLRFAAPAVGVEPPEALLHELSGQLGLLQATRAEAQGAPVTLTSVANEDPDFSTQTLTDYTVLWLSVPRPRGDLVVGAVALTAGSEPLLPLDDSWLSAVARAIYAAEDVRTVYLRTEQSPLATLPG
jgi:hypothetical protein